MIGFEHQGVTPREHRLDMRRRYPRVGQHAQSAYAIGEYVMKRFARIMRNGKRCDFERTDGLHMAIMKESAHCAGIGLRVSFPISFQRAMAQVHRNRVSARERENPSDMIVVFMRDQNGRQFSGVDAQPLKPRFGFFHGEPAIKQQSGSIVLHNEAIAFAATPQGRESHAVNSML